MNRNVIELNKQVESIITDCSQNDELLIDALEFKSKCNLYEYSARNTLLIEKQNPYVTFVGTYKKWKDLGYSVIKKGGVKILAPAIRTTLILEENGKKILKPLKDATPDEKIKVKNQEIKTIKEQVYVVGNVFDISQTNCPIEDYPKLFHMGFPSQCNNAIYQIIKNYALEQGITVVDNDISSISLKGYFLPQKKKIVLNEKLQDTARLSVFTHELSHALLHDENSIKQKPILQIECEADALSFMIQSHLGLEIGKQDKYHITTNYLKCADKDGKILSSILNTASQKYKDICQEIEHELISIQTTCNLEHKNITPERTVEENDYDVYKQKAGTNRPSYDIKIFQKGANKCDTVYRYRASRILYIGSCKSKTNSNQDNRSCHLFGKYSKSCTARKV